MFIENKIKVDSLRKQLESDNEKCFWFSVAGQYKPSKIQQKGKQYTISLQPIPGVGLPVVEGHNDSLQGLKRALCSRFQNGIFSETASPYDIRLGESRRDLLRDKTTSEESKRLTDETQRRIDEDKTRRRDINSVISPEEKAAVWAEIKQRFLGVIKILPADWWTMHQGWNETQVLKYCESIGVIGLPNFEEIRQAYDFISARNGFYKSGLPLKRSEVVFAPKPFTPERRVFTAAECEQMRLQLVKGLGNGAKVTREKMLQVGMNDEQADALIEHLRATNGVGRSELEMLDRNKFRSDK